MPKPIILIAGATGRMGHTISKLVIADETLELGGAFDRAGAPGIGRDLGEMIGVDACGTQITTDFASLLTALPQETPTILIDFTMPMATTYHAGLCADHKIGHVIGTTGLSPEEEAIIERKAQHTAIVKAGNMSTGVTLLSVLVEKAAAALGEDFDIEITESHHRHKVDAPSGTALLLGEAAAAGRKVSLAEKSVTTRHGITGARDAGDIGFSVIRGGGIIGDHDVMFASEGEILTLSHHAIDRKLFAQGAIRAAKWLCQNKTTSSQNTLRKAGLYSMRDVLEL